MKVTVKVGEVAVTVEGLDLDRRQVTRLLMDCAGVAATLAEEPESAPLIGFTAHIERLPDDLAPEPTEDDD